MTVEYFGIRHHGPGSAAALVARLTELCPATVLIEGPADATDLLPWLAAKAMVPPVALLAFPADNPERVSFWPFAQYSPEYQGVCWAVGHGVPVAFIDLPSLAAFEDAEDAAPDRHADPLATLATAAGYEDGESWWADLVEQNPDPGPIFAAIADAMREVRAGEPDDATTLRREAHMRLAITAAAASANGPVAVVCGAWHVPALQEKHSLSADKKTVGVLPRKKAQLTWAPWTSPRLAMAVGYGAGVAAPGWCQHLWDTRGRADATSVWLARVAGVLRARGHLVSTASLIEAQRLAVALAAMRERPQAGFEELREACVACLFDGQTLLWRLVEDQLLLGNAVGEIPSDVPLAPLVDDFQKQAKAVKLVPEALPRDLTLDLRSDSGLARSTLLHRLNILGVPWGVLGDAGGSRGTFRENWRLEFQPVFTVELVTKLVYGPTIEQAASAMMAERLTETASLSALAGGVRDAMTAALPAAVESGLTLLQQRAGISSDCQDILASLPPIADVLRYGQARTIDLGSLATLAERLVAEASVNLVYAARGLDAEGALALSTLIEQADAAIKLLALDWTDGLRTTLGDAQATPRVAGCVASLLYESGALDAPAAVDLLALRLSPGTPVGDAAGFLEGFFSAAARRLIHDDGLRGAVDTWLVNLSEDDFIAYLPLMRRVLSSLDSMERKRLMDAVRGNRAKLPAGLAQAPDAAADWASQFDVLAGLLGGSDDQ